MINLIFLSNELMDERLQNDLKIPIEFISFAYIENCKFYRYKKTKLIVKGGEISRDWGNNRIYGAIFLIRNMYYIRVLDAYNACSLSRIFLNHPFDLNHREIGQVTLIEFNTLNDFARYKFKEQATINCWIYYGNNNNKKLNKVLNNRRRLTNGVDTKNFKKCFSQLKKRGVI